jgi:Concanavalin A-like lectin/glucanases superfamily
VAGWTSAAQRRPARGPVALLLLLAAVLAACLPAGSALAIFTTQATVTANTLSTAAAFPRCYSDAVLADNPVSFWRLDETSGTSAGDSKSGRNGTYTNGVTLAQTGALPDSINNKAAGFDGTDDYVNVPYAAAFNGATFTVEGWARLTGGVANYPTIAGSYYEAGSDLRGYWLGVGNNNRWWLQLSNGSGYTNIMGPAPTPNTWTHVVGTYDGTVGRLYVNGTLVASASGGYVVNPSTPFAIGAYQANGSWDGFFPGQLDEVAVYNTALTATQIRTHYNTGRCYKDLVLADTPVAYWRLGEAAGTLAAEGIRGRHGTYTNGPTLAQAGAVNGDANTAVGFNGSSQYVSVPYESALNPASVTLEAWAKPTGGAGTARTVLAAQDTNKGYLLGIGTDDKWRFTIGTGAATTVVTGSTVTLSSWAHLVATYNGTTATLYVNGISAGSAAATVSVNTTRPLGIGASDAGGSWGGYFPGSIDEVALYPSALSQTRVQAHYLVGRSYQDTVLDTGPVSYWRLGEAAGTSAADSKGTNTGTYTNGPVLAQPGALAGDSDTAVSFDGVNDNVAKSYTASLNPTQFTVEAWADPVGGAGYYGAVAASWYDDGVAPRGSGIWTSSSDQWEIWMGDGANYYVLTGPSIIPNAWTHLAYTFDGTTLRMYVNGSLAASRAAAHSPNASMAFGIGAAQYPGGGAHWQDFYHGQIDDVAVYNRALSATDVQLHYDSGRQ